jgi:hypothetical protein
MAGPKMDMFDKQIICVILANIHPVAIDTMAIGEYSHCVDDFLFRRWGLSSPLFESQDMHT